MEPSSLFGESIVRRIARHAERQPDALGLVFVSAAGTAVELSWARLQASIRAIASRFVEEGVQPGEVLFVLSPSPEEQTLAFLGAMAAGALPTILSFPSIKQSEERFHETLRPLALSTSARWIASARDLAPVAARAGVPARVLALDPVAVGDELAALPAPSASFLQFSSGTTGLRKCVRITGEMLAHQAEAYARALALREGDRVASWLPLYHDMGLVACLLLPLYHGNLSIHLSPFAWLKEPALLFRAASLYGATLMWLPNFAYPICADEVSDEALAGLDLRALRAIVNCSEPVRPRAHERFLRRFGRAGVGPEHLLACYAMAEATFAVTQTPPGVAARVDHVHAPPFLTGQHAVPAPAGATDAEVLSFVSSGRPIEGMEVRIDGHSDDAHRVGEILIRGPGVIPGYGVDGRSALDAFQGDGWYRTGDLGYLDGGELFVTGRADDLILCRGQNLNPADIEEIVGELPGSKPGRVVAFGVHDEARGTEDVVIALEPSGDVAPAELVRRIREDVRLRLDVAVTAVDLVAPGSLRKSTSGKLSRRSNRDDYVARLKAGGGDRRPRPAQAAAYVEPRDIWERQLAWLWEAALGVGPVGIHDGVFLDLGAGSAATMRVVAEIERLLGQEIQPAALLGADTVERQAALLRDRQRRGASGPLIPLQCRGAGSPLFLVHAAGGWAFPYVALARQLGEDRPVHAFQTLALETGAGASLTVEGMAREYLAAMRAAQPSGPYLLGGWSLGGLVAFEMATRLEQAGERVARLVLFDTAPPLRRTKQAQARAMGAAASAALRLGLRVPWIVPRISFLRPILALSPVWRFFALYLMTGEERDLAPMIELAFGDRCDRARLARLGPDERWDYAIALAHASAGPADRMLLMPGLDGAGARRALRVSRRLEELSGRYTPAHRYGGRVDIFGCEGNERLRAWREHADGGVEVQSFPIRRHLIGPHFDMMEAPNVALFAPALRRLLAEASL
jgi:fatty-acyl-CoA synthase